MATPPGHGEGVPILLVTGFLGAGKTTLINRLLTNPAGRILAAIVNDFGAIDIDAALLSGTAEGVVSLKNGCICCSLQGDLLRTLAAILKRDPRPDGIVIETSGVSDPAEIIRALLDPVIFREAALDAVICLADARHLTDCPDLFADALCRAQLDAADFVALTKTDLVDEAACHDLRAKLARPGRHLLDVHHGAIPPELLFSANLHQSGDLATRPGYSSYRFESISWRSQSPLSLPRFQTVIGQLAKNLIRGKAILTTIEHPGQTMLFQLVGRRATLIPIDLATPETVRVVLIGEIGRLDEPAIIGMLERCIP